MNVKVKKGVIIVGIIILLFVFYNLFWYAVVWNKYSGFIDNMKELYWHRTYVIDDFEGYTYNVKIPDYLSYTGNLGIHASQNSDCALLIWPGIFKETEYGVFIEDGDGRSYAIELTENHEAKPDATEKEFQLVDEYKEKIDLLFDLAALQWSY